MNPKALKTLEYNKIIDKLTEFAGSALAKEMCRNLQPSTDLYEIQALQKETSDALSRIYQKGAVSFRGVRDIRGSIKRLEIGAIGEDGSYYSLKDESEPDEPNSDLRRHR